MTPLNAGHGHEEGVAGQAVAVRSSTEPNARSQQPPETPLGIGVDAAPSANPEAIAESPEGRAGTVATRQRPFSPEVPENGKVA